MKQTLFLEEIKTLYYQEELSTSQIAEKTGITKWQIIRFMKKNDLLRRKPSESNRLRFLNEELTFKIKAVLTDSDERLKLAACMLYWAEGSKGENQVTVDFVNSDYKMIKIFLKFLRKICGVNEKKLRVLLYCYANQDVFALIHYWAKVTNIPQDQFQKPYVRKDYNPNGRKMVSGLVHIRYNDKKLFDLLIKWINEVKEL